MEVRNNVVSRETRKYEGIAPPFSEENFIGRSTGQRIIPARAVDDGFSANEPVPVDILQETGLDRFDCGVAGRHSGSRRDEVTVAVGIPYRILTGTVLPGHLVAG